MSALLQIQLIYLEFAHPCHCGWCVSCSWMLPLPWRCLREQHSLCSGFPWMQAPTGLVCGMAGCPGNTPLCSSSSGHPAEPPAPASRRPLQLCQGLELLGSIAEPLLLLGCWNTAPLGKGVLKRAIPHHSVSFLPEIFSGDVFCWFKCKEGGFPCLSTSSAWSLSSCAFSGSCFISNNNKSFLNKRDLEALAFLPFKCEDHYLSSCSPESSLPVWHPPRVALAQLRKNRHEPFLQWAFQRYCLTQVQLYVSVTLRFFTSLQDILQISIFFLYIFFLVVYLYFTGLVCEALFFLFHPFVLSFWISRFPLRSPLDQKYFCSWSFTCSLSLSPAVDNGFIVKLEK